MTGALLAFGALIIAALVVGRFASWVRVPRVTGYLLTGVVLGPSFAHAVGLPPLVSEETIQGFTPISQVALAMIVFAVGGEFQFASLRRWFRRTVTLVAADFTVPFLLVFGATWLMGASVPMAVLLGIVAASGAPAATAMVIREFEADGELSHLMMTLLGATSFVCIIAFQIAAHVFVTPDEPWSAVLPTLAIPMALGAGAGLLVSYWEQRIGRVAERQLMTLAVLIVCTGAARFFDVSVLLTTLVAGVVVGNASPHERRVFEELQRIDYPFYVPFFVLAGANLHLQALPHLGLVGVAYLLARTAGKVLGDGIGARLGRFGPTAERWLGAGMLAQAGVAVGFAAQLGETWGEQGQRAEALILAAILVFEVVGPVLTRAALVHGGEVTILTVLARRAPVGVFEGMHQVVEHFRRSLGIPSWHKLEDPRDVLVQHVMRRNVETIQDNLSFSQLLQVLGHSRYDRIPVLDKNGKLVGQVRYADLSHTLFDETLSSLVIARDLITPEPLTLRANDTLQHALELFGVHRDVISVPVVSPDDPARLVGIVRQNDVLAACRRL
ncbi:MAG: cation:proton antiporter [Myxococcota bacterium]